MQPRGTVPVSESDSDSTDKQYNASDNRPFIHRGVDAPICDHCQLHEFVFFNPHCEGCQALLCHPTTTIAELFAVLRQWTPQTQSNIMMILNEILGRGAHIDDRDGLTDMTMLHYASKSGAHGIGDPNMAAEAVSTLLARGAYPDIRCRWTHMSPLHYAVYFDVAPVVSTLLTATKALDIDSTCSEFDHGSALHIAAANLSYQAVKVLLDYGANPSICNDMGRTALDCVPDAELFNGDEEIIQTVDDIRTLLYESIQAFNTPKPTNHDGAISKVTLRAMDMNIGDRIVVGSGGSSKFGTLRYCGTTKFAAGIWAGIELDDPVGKNDGSVAGVYYFHSSPEYGIFAPISRVSKPGMVAHRTVSLGSARKTAPSAAGILDVSHVGAKIDTGLHRSTASNGESDEIQMNDRVVVAGKRRGVIKFIGPTDFAPGTWYGIVLDKTEGKNDGSVNGQRYFTCESMHGVFSPVTRIKKLGPDDFGSSDSIDQMSLSVYVPRRTSASSASKNIMSVSMKSPSQTRARSAPNPGIIRKPGASSTLILCVGTTVFCNNGMGTVRYIGLTHFAEGLWVGVELRSDRGKNDGSVQGHRYFTCKQGHGVIVKPNKISVRGISGTTLLANYVPGPLK